MRSLVCQDQELHQLRQQLEAERQRHVKEVQQARKEAEHFKNVAQHGRRLKASKPHPFVSLTQSEREALEEPETKANVPWTSKKYSIYYRTAADAASVMAAEGLMTPFDA